MKRICAFILCVVMLLLFTAPSVFADAEQSKPQMLENAVYYTCDYDAKGNRVIIEGTVNHDFMISHSDYTIKVMSVLPGESYENVINAPNTTALAEAAMTVKFTFYIEISGNIERYSKYAILFCSPDGENLLTGEPKMPSVSSEFSYDPANRTGFKGFMSGDAASISNSGAGTVIIDVDFGKMMGDTADSILYPMNDSYIHVRKSYIANIDKSVLSAAVGESRIYFRFLLSSSNNVIETYDADNTKKYGIPNVYSETVIDYVITLTDFLVERYGTEESGLDGIIVGSCIDDTEMANAIGGMSVEEYAELYTMYLTVLANSVRERDNTVDVVIPLSDANDYVSELREDDPIKASVLLDGIIRRLANTVSGKVDCSVMLESHETPLGISCESIGNGIHTDFEYDQTKIGVKNISDFTAYLYELSSKYENVPSNVIYMWHADGELSGDALCCAYAYMFKTLSTNTVISSFVADFGDNEDSAYRLFKYIDTGRSDEMLSRLLKYFDDTSWSVAALPLHRILIEKSFSHDRPIGVLGEFQYMDFTSSSVFEFMNVGAGCEYIRSDYNSVGERALRVGTTALSVGDTAECIGFFEYGEDYSYTPYLSLKLEVDDAKASDAAIYEVSLTVGMGNSRTVAIGNVRNREQCELFFDVSEFADMSMGDYIKISVRCLTEDTEGLSLWMHEIRGYSTQYNSEELSDLIEQKRREIRGEDESDDGGFDYTVVFTVIGVLFALGAVTVGLFMVFKRENYEDKTGNSK